MDSIINIDLLRQINLQLLLPYRKMQRVVSHGVDYNDVNSNTRIAWPRWLPQSMRAPIFTTLFIFPPSRASSAWSKTRAHPYLQPCSNDADITWRRWSGSCTSTSPEKFETDIDRAATIENSHRRLAAYSGFRLQKNPYPFCIKLRWNLTK